MKSLVVGKSQMNAADVRSFDQSLRVLKGDVVASLLCDETAVVIDFYESSDRLQGKLIRSTFTLIGGRIKHLSSQRIK